LSIEARIEVEEAVNNAQSPSEFETELKVLVSRAGAPVSGATVVVETSAGPISLEPSEETGIYEASRAGYARTFSLSVQAGEDHVDDAQVIGPEAHSFSSPQEASTHPPGQPLNVSWAPFGAQEATIETEQMSPTVTPDTGTFVIAASFLQGKTGESEEDRVRVTRSQRFDLAGAEEGSSIDVRIRNQVEFNILAR
jgi:hypothetical protein